MLGDLRRAGGDAAYGRRRQRADEIHREPARRAASLGGVTGEPPVTLMGGETAGRLRRSMMKSWPLGLREIASSIACSRVSFASESLSGVRRSAASSWPRHM